MVVSDLSGIIDSYDKSWILDKERHQIHLIHFHQRVMCKLLFLYQGYPLLIDGAPKRRGQTGGREERHRHTQQDVQQSVRVPSAGTQRSTAFQETNGHVEPMAPHGSSAVV